MRSGQNRQSAWLRRIRILSLERRTPNPRFFGARSLPSCSVGSMTEDTASRTQRASSSPPILVSGRDFQTGFSSYRWIQEPSQRGKPGCYETDVCPGRKDRLPFAVKLQRETPGSVRLAENDRSGLQGGREQLWFQGGDFLIPGSPSGTDNSRLSQLTAQSFFVWIPEKNPAFRGKNRVHVGGRG